MGETHELHLLRWGDSQKSTQDYVTITHSRQNDSCVSSSYSYMSGQIGEEAFNPQCRFPDGTMVFFPDINGRLYRSKVVEHTGSKTKIHYLGYNSQEKEVFDTKSI